MKKKNKWKHLPICTLRKVRWKLLGKSYRKLNRPWVRLTEEEDCNTSYRAGKVDITEIRHIPGQHGKQMPPKKTVECTCSVTYAFKPKDLQTASQSFALQLPRLLRTPQAIQIYPGVIEYSLETLRLKTAGMLAQDNVYLVRNEMSQGLSYERCYWWCAKWQ